MGDAFSVPFILSCPYISLKQWLYTDTTSIIIYVWSYGYFVNHNYNKILKSDWLWQYASRLSNWTICAITRSLKWHFFTTGKKKVLGFLVFFDFKKEPYISQILLKLWLISNRTSCRPIRSVIIRLVIKQIGLPLRGRLILLTSRMITDRIGLNSMLLSLLICCWKIGMWNITIFLMT